MREVGGAVSARDGRTHREGGFGEPLASERKVPSNSEPQAGTYMGRVYVPLESSISGYTWYSRNNVSTKGKYSRVVVL